MKKRIVALVSALTLVFAMSLNVAAAGSITAAETTEIENAAGDVWFPATTEDLEESAELADMLLVTEDVTIAPLTEAASAKTLAEEVATMSKKDNVDKVVVLAVFEIDGKAGDVTFVVGELKDNEKAVIKHMKADGSVEEIVGDYADGKATFKFASFSPAALVIVVEKVVDEKPADQPPYNPAWDPTSPSYIGNTNASAPAAAPVVVAAPVAPKTGDVVMMVSIMAIIFMAGAAVAVAMSKKRA